MNRLIYNLKEIGIDTDRVITILGGNESLYLTLSLKFINDQNYALFKNAIDAKEYQEATNYIHTLKGVAANLGYDKLSLLCKSILTMLKQNDYTQINEETQVMSIEYNKIKRIIKSIYE